MVTGAEQSEDGVLGGHPAAEAEPLRRSLQRGDAAFQGRPGGVARPGVEPAPIPLDVVLDEQRRLVDGHRHRPGGRVGLLAGVDRPGLEGQFVHGRAA